MGKKHLCRLPKKLNTKFGYVFCPDCGLNVNHLIPQQTRELFRLLYQRNRKL
jgi:hypothetical protein